MKFKRILALIICLITLLSSLPIFELEGFGEEDTTKIITASDFQPRDGASVGIGKVRKILYAMKQNGVDSADGFFFCGDYDYYTYGDTKETKEGITALTNALKSTVKQENMVFIQGNHDAVAGTAGQNPSGNNDPKTGKYGVFVINNDDYMWYNGDEARIKKTTQRLIDYLNEKLACGYDKPIFVLSHLPLHYSMRTRLEGDAKYANYLFDALNEAGEKGLNIVYLFGHDHANGWDDYLGGSSVYLAKGDTIQIAQKSQNVFKRKTLNFTYMNAGYTGYYDNHNGADDALTMSYMEIAPDGTVTVSRYDEKGVHNLKSEGKRNSYRNESGYLPDTKVYTSPQVISPTKVTDKTPIESIMELNEQGRTYKRINNVSELRDGASYLVVYNASADKIMVPEVVTKSNADGTRIGFKLEKSFAFGEGLAFGEFGQMEWTFSKSGNAWKLSHNGKYIKLTPTTDKKITATLEDEGNMFTISGESSYTFKSGSYLFNYNVRDLMNAFTSDPASFYIYEHVGYSLNLKDTVAEINNSSVKYALEGELVTIKAEKAPEGYTFDRFIISGDITLSEIENGQAQFTMINAPISISASYKKEDAKPSITPTPQQTQTAAPDTKQDQPTNQGPTIYIVIIAVALIAIGAAVVVIVKIKQSKNKNK